jgi:hypothetical protein
MERVVPIRYKILLSNVFEHFRDCKYEINVITRVKCCLGSNIFLEPHYFFINTYQFSCIMHFIPLHMKAHFLHKLLWFLIERRKNIFHFLSKYYHPGLVVLKGLKYLNIVLASSNDYMTERISTGVGPTKTDFYPWIDFHTSRSYRMHHERQQQQQKQQ